MKYVCAYCNEELRPETTGKEGVSHGICPSCYNHIKASLGVDLKEYLNMLDHPVFLVDDDVKVLSANYKARHLNGDKIHSIINKRLGEVFECENAIRSEGCGRSVCCSGCTIRRSVSTTYKTGDPVMKKPASLVSAISGIPTTIDLYITTYKVGKVVFLMVEPSEEEN